MSVALSRTRVVLRAAVATAALAGALCTPALAFAAGHGSATAVANGTSGSSADCTVTKTMPSAILGMTVTLTNSTAGPSADLKDDESGKTVATVNRSHPEDLAAGLRITGADTATPLFLDRSQGGNTPWRTTPFPTLPTSCTDTGTGTDTDTDTPEETGTGNGSDTGTGADEGAGTGTGTGTGTDTGAGKDTGAKPGTDPEAAKCTVTKTMPSAILGMTVTLTNSTAGPSADLKDDESGKTVATVNRSHPEDLAAGLRITGADTATPLFLDRSQGGNTPWRTTPFPTLPTSCTDTGTGTETGTPEETGTGTAQTKVVPAGGVAAGAEGVEETDGTMVAGGAAVAAAGLLGLGFAVRSRRGARSGA